MPRRRLRHSPEHEDFGPVESLRSGRVIVLGERPYRQGRVVSVLFSFGRTEQEAAMRVLDLFERAHFSGFTCSTLERKPGSGFHDIAPGESAIAARRALAAIQQRLTAEHWSVIWHVLAFGEAQSAFALRVRCRKAAVRPMLQSALMAVAALSRAR